MMSILKAYYKYYNVLLQQSKKHAAKVREKNGCVIILFIILLWSSLHERFYVDSRIKCRNNIFLH